MIFLTRPKSLSVSTDIDLFDIFNILTLIPDSINLFISISSISSKDVLFLIEENFFNDLYGNE